MSNITIDELYQSIDEAIREHNEKFEDVYSLTNQFNDLITEQSKVIYQLVALYNCKELEFRALKNSLPRKSIHDINQEWRNAMLNHNEKSKDEEKHVNFFS